MIRAILCLDRADQASLDDQLGRALVQDMDDGGMGSLQFLSVAGNRSSCHALAEAEYIDDDGVLVSIVVNGETVAALAELDFWKVDFSPLRRYPSPADLKVKNMQEPGA